MTPQELFELALSYYNGTDNIPQDYLKAYDLFLEAAEAGHIGSQSYLGRMLSMGEGVFCYHKGCLMTGRFTFYLCYLC